MKNITLLAISSSLLLIYASASSATTLTSQVNVDNGFKEYLSSSPTDLTNATLVQSGSNWTVTDSNNTATLSGSTEYLIIEALNWGGIGGLLGSFSLSNSNYEFANGTQSLVTGAADWTVAMIESSTDTYTNNISGTYSNATVEGINGVGPWGYESGVSSQASWISDATDGYGLQSNNCAGYSSGCTVDVFETAIYSTASITQNDAITASVPEPETLTMFAIGLLGIAATRKKA
ncbi:MAG: PEP-CTERM sorting domain-containing protein [Methylomonas sp.]|jgi:hypothetical protein